MYMVNKQRDGLFCLFLIFKSCNSTKYVLLIHQQCLWKDIDEYVVRLTDEFTIRLVNFYCTLCETQRQSGQ